MAKQRKNSRFSFLGAALAKLASMRKTPASEANTETLGRPSPRPATEPFVDELGEAQALLQAGKVDKAADAFQTILSRDANLEAHIGLIRGYQRRREWSEGLKEAEIALAAFPHSAVLAALKGELLLALNRMDEAEQADFDISNAGTQKYTSGSADRNIAERGPNNTADLERWMASVVANFTPQELKEGVSALDKASDEAQRQYRDEEVIRLRTRAVEYLDALHTVEMNLPAWIDQVYAKQLRQSALAYDRLASARKEQDDAEAARYWAQGIQCLGQLLARVPEQPEWVTELHQKMARQGALACDRLASARKEQDDTEAARYWAQGSQCLEQLLARVPEQPEWVTELHQKMARQGALACDRLASA